MPRGINFHVNTLDWAMPTLYLLGTGAAVSDPERTTTMLALGDEHSIILIDCGGDVLQHAMQAGIDTNKLSALIVSHEHADHVSGFPLFMEKIWLLGRREAVPVYGIDPAIRQAQRVHDAFDTADWPDYPGNSWHRFEAVENSVVLDDASWYITASPGQHSVPVVGLRALHKSSGKVLVYSCDTEKSEVITRLAGGADLLVHEATGAFPGHATAMEAAEVAKDAGAKRLLLVHLPPEAELGEDEMAKVQAIFAATEKGKEGGSYSI